MHCSTTRIVNRLLAVVVLSVIGIGTAFPLVAVAQSPADKTSPVARESILKAARAEMKRQGIPGMSLAIAVDGKIVVNEGLGLADVENEVPVRPQTLFRTASIAKPMTATLVMQLAENGLLDLDEDVHQYCQYFPPKEWPVTSRHLMGHLSGVRHYKSPAEAASKEHFFNTRDAIAVFADDPLRHQPGTKFLYSSFGYNLLGAVAESAVDQPFAIQLRQGVWGPAGMQSTSVDNSFEVLPGRARGYVRFTPQQIAALPAGHAYVAGKLYNAPLHDTSMKVPGGGLVSTSADLCRFAMALHEGRLLKPSSLKMMWTEQQTASGEGTQYGLGWAVHEDGTLSHGGGQAGTSTFLIHDPQRRLAVAAMSNLQGIRLGDFCRRLLVQHQQDRTTLADVEAQLTAAIEYEVAQKRLPAFSLALVDGQETVYAAGFGFEDAQGKRRATADTIYRVGSVSKLFTDIAVMQLVERGELDLDADVQQYLPGFQPKIPDGSKITLRQLMSHRAGLVRESPVGNYFDPTEPSLEATVASLNQTSLTYPPDTRTKYSNAGVAVAGLVLQKKTGVRFEDYLQKTLLRPMKMRRSAFQRTKAIDAGLADAWMWTVDGRRFAAPKFALGTAPAGSLYSSVNDLAKFIQVILQDGRSGKRQVIGEETLNKMTKVQLDAEGNPLRFGIGFGISQFDGHHAVGHGGAIYGFSTQFRVLPNEELGVAAVTSLDGANGVVRRLSDYALRLMLAHRERQPLPDYPRSEPVDLKQARRLAGLYEGNDGQWLRLTERDGKLFMRRGSYRREVRQWNDEFVVDDVHGWGPVLQADSKDQVQGLVIEGNRFAKVRDRLPEQVPDRWRGLIGEYGWDHNALIIFEDRGQLYALIEWLYFYPLEEISESVFAFPDYGLYHGERLIFERGSDPQRRAKSVIAAEVKFQRRSLGADDGTTFRIKPLKPVAELLEAAKQAKPPEEDGAFLRADLVDVTSLDKSIRLDIRYASENNFMSSKFYAQPRAFLQKPAAEALVAAHRSLRDQGLGVLIHDAYRPWFVTKTFWDATPGSMKDFVANPDNGSRHNRGCAVDLTLYHLNSGEPVSTVAGYDEFSYRSFPAYPGGTARQRWYRELLRSTMQEAGFTIYEYEWWHFDYKDWQRYAIQNKTFEELAPR